MKIGIIGAGITGLTAAYDLIRNGHQVTIYEAASQAGGLASGFRDASWEWSLERFYHHLFTTDQAIIKLVETIGCRDKLFFQSPITAQWWNGRGYPIFGGLSPLRLPRMKEIPIPALASTALSVLTYPGLSFPSRIRMGIVGAYLKYGIRDWQVLERSTAADWTRRVMGEAAYRAFVHPLLEGKFGEYTPEVNMAWLWARLKTRSFKLGYFVGGFQGFVDALLATVRKWGGVVYLDARVHRLEQHSEGWRIQCERDVDHYDQIIVTGSPQLLGKLAPQLPEGYLSKLTTLRSMGAVVMTLALTRPLTKNLYWINMPKGQFPFLALVEHTNFVDAKYYGGDHLIYCGDYLAPTHEYFRMTESELVAQFLPALSRVNPHFDPSWVRAMWLHRETYAQPIVPVNHSHAIPPLATPLSGLYWASMSQVYPWDRGTNFAVELGQQVALEVIKNL